MANLLLVLLLLGIKLANCSFPKCDDIIVTVDGKTNCAYCGTERIKNQCKSACDSKCQVKPTANSSTSNNGSNGTKPVSGDNGSGSSKCNDIDPCVDIKEANKKYRARCKAAQLQETCWDYCRYDATKKQLQDAFLHNKCDLGEAQDMLLAAANDKDNSKCCKKKNVLTGDKAICEPFCNPNSKNWPTKAEAKYLRCLSMFDSIMACHWASCRP